MAGRKSLAENWITPDGLLCIEGWAREGLVEAQIAKNIGINPATLYVWKSKYPEIVDALKRGKRPVDIEVENKLLKRAMGYEYEEVTTEIIEQPDGSKRKHIKKTLKQVLPDTTAQIFWLKNRRPDLWRDKRDVVTSAPGQLADLIDGLKEPCTYDLHTEAEGLDGTLEDEQAETD